MDNIIVSFNVIAPVFFLMVLGYFLVNYTSLADGKLTKQANAIVFKNYKSLDELLKAGWDVGVAWQDGRPFHQKYGIRMNLALPLGRVKEAFERLDEYVFHV